MTLRQPGTVSRTGNLRQSFCNSSGPKVLEDCVTEAFRAACRAVAARSDFKEHPYFVWMRRASKEPFALSQIPFVYAVEEFPCALGACLSKLGRVDIRAELAGNIAEEHGHGNPYETHKQTFMTYLAALGVPPRLLSVIEYPIGIRAFNENIRNYCLVHSGEEGAAMLGMIESLYSGISAQIASHIHQERWVEPGAQKHYAVHAALDVEHAHELFRIAAPAWESPVTRARIEAA